MTEMPEVWSQPIPRVPLSNYQSLDIAKIRPSRFQARKAFDEESIKTLAESIREEGLLEPIVVRQVAEEYELISGERRLRACMLLGLTTIDARIIPIVSEAEAAAKGLIENLQREDLNPIEEAEGFEALLDLQDSHWTQGQVGKVVGRPQSRISESLRLLRLPESVVQNIRQRIISREHGVELLRLNNANSLNGIVNNILKEGWSVKKTRDAIDKKLQGSGRGGRLPARESKANGSFHFIQEGTRLKLSAYFDRTAAVDDLTADFRAALVQWINDHPNAKASAT